MPARFPARLAERGPWPTVGLMVLALMVVVLPVGRAKWGLAVALLTFAAVRAGQVAGVEALAAGFGALVAALLAALGVQVLLAYLAGFVSVGVALVGYRLARDRGLLG